ncbi:AMP-binding protein [Nocardioides montaniterrae]
MDYVSPGNDFDEAVSGLSRWLSSTADGAATPLLVETSGSSGTPKRVVLSRSAVLASVGASAARLGGSGPWVLALPSTYVAGVQVIVRSLLAGHAPTLLERSGWPTGSGWSTSLVPTQLTRFLASPADAEALARASTVLLGGGPIDPSLRTAAAEAGVNVVATYGAAETAGGCVYDGLPLDGVAVALGTDGRIRISGPTLFSGYDGAPELTAETLVDGWYLTSDAGRIDADGRLQVLGRLDDVIVSGGVNVPGPAVAARLREHPRMREVEVLGVPDEEWGNRVVAFLVGRHEPPLEHVRDWVEAGGLPRAWAPRQLVVLGELPLLPNGKVDRMALRGMALRGTA